MVAQEQGTDLSTVAGQSDGFNARLPALVERTFLYFLPCSLEADNLREIWVRNQDNPPRHDKMCSHDAYNQVKTNGKLIAR